MSERIFRVRDNTQQRDMFVNAFNAGRQFTDPYEIVLRPIKAKRSGPQNKRYWLLLREVAATVWIEVFDDDGKSLGMKQFKDTAWHEHYKREFIGVEEIDLPCGKRETRGISTTTLSVEEMEKYMRSIEQWCVEQGFPVMESAA